MSAVKSAHVLQPMVRKLSQWRPLDQADSEAILALPHRILNFRAQEYIVREGDEPKHSCLILSGFAFRQKVAGNGGRQIVSIHMKGDLADLQNSLLGVADHSLQALTHVEAAMISVDAIQNLAFDRPAIGRALWYETLVDASIFREWVLNVGRRDARTRLAHLLCEFALRMEAQGLIDGGGFELPITQEQLADAVGLTPVHVNRTLKSLEADGLITRNKRNIVFPSWERMRDVGDFNPRYLHLDRQESAYVQ